MWQPSPVLRISKVPREKTHPNSELPQESAVLVQQQTGKHLGWVSGSIFAIKNDVLERISKQDCGNNKSKDFKNEAKNSEKDYMI